MRIESDHWFINENKFSISLMNYCAVIEMYPVGDDILFSLVIIDPDLRKLELTFTKLEDAISFAENDVGKCYSFAEMLERYAEKIYGIKLTLK